ncbi:hypothetical protein CFC21_043427, partial [Triticum aestivum]
MRMALAAAFLLLALLPAAEASGQVGDEEAGDKGWECSGSRLCCKRTITDFFKARHSRSSSPGGTTPSPTRRLLELPGLHRRRRALRAPRVRHHRRQGDGRQGGRRLPRPRRRQHLV